MNEQDAAIELLPMPISIVLKYPERVTRVRDELELAALTDPNGCYGYFPDGQGLKGEGLFHSRYFEFCMPHLDLWQGKFSFSFLRLSLVQQESLYGLHLDANAGTGLGESNASTKRSWRSILNLGSYVRRLVYSIQDPTEADLEDKGSIRIAHSLDHRKLRTMLIPPREKHIAHGIIFCASHVLHGGEDDENGHFIASYGLEEAIT